MSLNRRGLLTGLSATTIALSALAVRSQATAQDRDPNLGYRGSVNEVEGYGPLIPDPAGLIDLPQGFSYTAFSKYGDVMDDGFYVPTRHDGMGAFAHSDPDKVVLVRNHEITPNVRGRGPTGKDYVLQDKLPRDKVYDFLKDDRPCSGGTTTLVYNIKTKQLEEHYLSLTGTVTNCSGGTTPWGSWLTCEENVSRAGDGVQKDHGFIFEVPSGHRGLVDPVPLTAMGRFNHEATAHDPRTGVVYLTEDRVDGLFYRFLPNDKRELHKGGRLQVLVIRDVPSADTTNHKSHFWSKGQSFKADWIDAGDPLSPDDSLRKEGYAAGAAKFARGEGIHCGLNDRDELEFYFTCTSGGQKGFGQIMRYVPSRFEGQPQERDEPGRLELFVESQDERVLDYADNLIVSPWGHLFVCEDRYSDILLNHLKIVTPQGQVTTFANNRVEGNPEWAGVCFSPDGSTLFANIYTPGVTVAITGPWDRFSDAVIGA